MDTELYVADVLPLRAKRLELMDLLISGSMTIIGIVAVSLGLH